MKTFATKGLATARLAENVTDIYIHTCIVMALLRSYDKRACKHKYGFRMSGKNKK